MKSEIPLPLVEGLAAARPPLVLQPVDADKVKWVGLNVWYQHDISIHMSYIMCMTYVWHVYDICMACVWHMYDNDEEDWPVLCTPLASATPSASASSPPVEPSWGKSSYCLHIHHLQYPLPLCISDPNKVVFPSDSKVCLTNTGWQTDTFPWTFF